MANKTKDIEPANEFREEEAQNDERKPLQVKPAAASKFVETPFDLYCPSMAKRSNGESVKCVAATGHGLAEQQCGGIDSVILVEARTRGNGRDERCG